MSNTLSFTGHAAVSVSKGSNTSATLTFSAPLDRTVAGSTLLIVPVDGIAALGVSDKFVLPTAGVTANIDGIVSASLIRDKTNDANLSGDFLTNSGSPNGPESRHPRIRTQPPISTVPTVNAVRSRRMRTKRSCTTNPGDHVGAQGHTGIHVIDLGTKQLQVEATASCQAPTGVIFNGGTIQNGTLEFAQNNGVVYTSLVGGTISSVIDGTEGLTIFGPGKLTLSGNNTYTGGTTVNSGNLDLTGTMAAGTVSVAPGAVLSGTGRITNNIQGGMISPGDHVGILTAASVTTAVDVNLALRNFTNFSFEFDNTGLPIFSSNTESGNDLLHLTSHSAKPFSSSLTSKATSSTSISTSSFGVATSGQDLLWAASSRMTTPPSTARSSARRTMSS